MIENNKLYNPKNQVLTSSTPSDSTVLPKYSRRDFLRLAGTTAAGTALASCTSTLSSAKKRKIQLVYQDSRTDWFAPMAQQMLEEFHATHPNIQVFYTPEPENPREKMLTEMQFGVAADVFQGCCEYFPIWAQKGYTLDLRPYVEADLDKATIAEWDTAQYNTLFTREGQQYALPKYLGGLALYYNKDLFDQYKVDYPNAEWTYDDYLAAMKRLTHDRDGDGQTDLWGSMMDRFWDRIQIHVNGWGGHLVDPQNPLRCRMADSEALAAMEWLRARMWDDKVMATLLDVQNVMIRDAFIAEKVAMLEEGSWALKDILIGAKFRIGVAPFPAGPTRRVTLATTDGFGIYAGTKYPEAAWELVKFLISKDYGRAMARADFLQPARVSLVEEWAAYIRAEFPEKTRGLDLVAFADGQIKGYSVTAEIFANMAIAQRLAESAWSQIFTVGSAPVSLMQTVCRNIEAIQPETR